MITNAYILAECVKKDVKPTFYIDNISGTVSMASYDWVYGAEYIPSPIPQFPVGTNFQFCIDKTVTTPINGVKFRFYMPADFIQGVSQVQINYSGDKNFKTSFSYTLDYSIYDAPSYLYETDVGLPIKVVTPIAWFKGLWASSGAAGVLHYYSNEFFWRCRIKKEVEGLSGVYYYSAWSQESSFKFEYREALKGVRGWKIDDDPGSPSVTDETGLLFDGSWYW